MLLATLLAMMALLAMLASASHAASTYWVAAGNSPAASGGDGSAEAPFASLGAALTSGQLAGGDRLQLMAGSHGEQAIRNAQFDPPLTITSAPGGRAHFDALRVHDSTGLSFHALDIWPREGVELRRRIVVSVAPSASQILLEDLDIRGHPDAEHFRDWDKPAWKKRRVKGAQIDGADSVLANSTITGVSTGVGAFGARAEIRDNEIRGFTRDGMRVFGKDMLVEGNVIRDCIDIDGNHDDGIQSWAKRGRAPDVIEGITIRGNRILEWTGEKSHPLRCRLQGIGLFNGPYRGWVIENNLIAVRTSHGLVLGSMGDSRVVHNTIVNIDGTPGRKPWLTMGKSTQANDKNIIANNVAQGMRPGKGPLAKELRRTNVIQPNSARLYQNPAEGDYRPILNGPLHDRAHLSGANRADIDGTPRPQGNAPDIGAFER